MASLRWTGGSVTAAWHRPPSGAGTAVALTHGAGGDLDDPLLVALGTALAGRGIAVVRFNLPYREAGRRAPGAQASSEACWRDVAAALRTDFARTYIGGKSYGGRIASHVAADGAHCDGLVLLSYPLHPPGKPERLRDAHLSAIGVPMLICQGTKDPFATPELLRAVVARLPRATLHDVVGADHSLGVRGRDQTAVAGELAGTIAAWIDK